MKRKKNKLLIGNYEIANVNLEKNLCVSPIPLYFSKSIDRHIMKMAAVTNTLKRISELFREQTRQLNLIALVVNQLHYYMLLIAGLLFASSKNRFSITFEK